MRRAQLLDLAKLKSPSDDEDDESQYNPFDISGLQLYNPVYSVLFGSTVVDPATVALDHPYEVVDANHVRDVRNSNKSPREIHFKFSPLLDPFAYMIGKYDQISAEMALPQPNDSKTDKINDPCNAAYVDCFFNYLSNLLLETHGFKHGISYYGSYVGVQKKFKLNVTDDMDHLRNSRFFNENLGKLFTVPGLENDFLNVIGGSRRNKRKIDVVEDALLDNVECLDGVAAAENGTVDEPAVETVYEREVAPHHRSDRSSTSSSSSDSELNYTSDDNDDDASSVVSSDEYEDGTWIKNNEEESGSSEEEEEEEEEESDDDDDSDDEEETVGYINDFPTQIICMEKCEGTLDELFVSGTMDIDQGSSAMMQVIMTLLAYQKAFGFTHNDLHTNNIMWISTDLEHLDYQYQGRRYRVPTYGRIYKIIDFGRSIYRYQGHLFCSDSFFNKGDAATQYNFGPFLNPQKPVLEPNPSFDLCRLGVSVFDFIMGTDTDVGDMDPFQKTIRRWCMDDNKHNVLYKRNGDDRYPNFKLYKMIARTVHKHTPEEQLNYAIFKQYLVTVVDEDIPVMNLDNIPSYQ